MAYAEGLAGSPSRYGRHAYGRLRRLTTGAAIALSGCSVDPITFTPLSDQVAIGGSISGLEGSGLVLTNSGADDLAILDNGAFAFATPVPSGTSYAVEVKTQPSNPAQVCSVSNGAGIAGGDRIVDIQISCSTTTFRVGGTLLGLGPGSSIVLQNNSGDDLAITGDGEFIFATPVASGAGYAVTVRTQPPGLTCRVAGGAGTVGDGNVTSIRVICEARTWSPDLFPIPVPGASFGVGDLTLDNNNDLLVVVSKPARAIVRISQATGEQTTVAAGIGGQNDFLLGVAHRAANDMIYASTDQGQIFEVTPTGVVTPIAQISGTAAIAFAPPSFGSFGGSLIGVTDQGLMFALDPDSGDLTIFASAPGTTSDLAFAPDGTLYLCGGTTVRTVSAGGVVTPFIDDVGSLVDGITITPDGTRMFVTDSVRDVVLQITIPGAVVTTVGAADIDSGSFVGGIIAAPGNTLIVMTGETSQTLIAFPF